MHTAEETAQQALTVARRAEGKADSTANGLLEHEQAIGRIERLLKQVQGELRVGLVSIRERLPPRKSETFTYEDLEETSNGTHYRATKETVERVLGALELKHDAQAWRKLWRRARWAVWLVAGGGLGYAGEQLLKLVLPHL